jgi:hypothetical protein
MAISNHGQLSADVTDLATGQDDDLSQFPFLDVPEDVKAGFEASAEILGVTPAELGDAILLWMVAEHQQHPDELPEGLGQAIQLLDSESGIDLNP